MIYTIQIETRSMYAYVAIHQIMVKAHVIKRRWNGICYYATITTRKGPQLYNNLTTALQEAGIHHVHYKIQIDPPPIP